MNDSRMNDLRRLPKVRNSLSYIYVEHTRVDKLDSSIAVYEADGTCMPIPASPLCLLMLGPGTRITQSAITTLADNNCLVSWYGEEGTRFYAYDWQAVVLRLRHRRPLQKRVDHSHRLPTGGGQHPQP